MLQKWPPSNDSKFLCVRCSDARMAPSCQEQAGEISVEIKGWIDELVSLIGKQVVVRIRLWSPMKLRAKPGSTMKILQYPQWELADERLWLLSAAVASWRRTFVHFKQFEGCTMNLFVCSGQAYCMLRDQSPQNVFKEECLKILLAVLISQKG